MPNVLYGILDGEYITNNHGNGEVIIKTSGQIETINEMTNVQFNSRSASLDILLNNFNNNLLYLTRQGWKVKSIQVNRVAHKKYLLEYIDESE